MASPQSEVSAKTAVGAAKQSSEATLADVRQMVRETRARPLLATLWALAREGKAMPGRKTIFLFSGDTQLSAATPELKRAIVGDANRSQVSFYSVDGSGVSAKEADRASHMMMDSMGMATSSTAVPNRASDLGISSSRRGFETASSHAQSAGLDDLAKSTGGVYIDASSDLRRKLRNAAGDVLECYLVTYAQPMASSDGRFRPVSVEVDRPGVTVLTRSGYTLTPPLAGRDAAPFEVPLLAALNSPAKAETIWFSAAPLHVNATGKPNSSVLAVQVPLNGSMAHENDAQRRFELRVSALALVRDATGAIVDVLSGDVTLDGASERLEQARSDSYTFQKAVHLGAGKYRVEIAVSDNVARKISAKSIEVANRPENESSLSDLVVVHALPPLASERDADSAPLRYEGLEVVPELNARGSLLAQAEQPVFFTVQLDSKSGAAVQVELTVAHDGELIARIPLAMPKSAANPVAFLPFLGKYLSVGGHYEVRVQVSEGTRKYERNVAFTLGERDRETEHAASYLHDNAAPPDANVSENLLPVPKLLTKARKPTAEEMDIMLRGARERVLDYKRTLPDFVCLMVTRRSFDSSGRGAWKASDAFTNLLGFMGGKEKTVLLEVNGKPVRAQEDAALDGAKVKGEFGELLSMPFAPESHASILWQGEAELSGRSVHVFRFDVKRAHSEYLVVANHTGQALDAAYHALIDVDAQTFCVRRISIVADDMPKNFTIRESVITVDYDYVPISGQEYLLPLHATLFVRHGAHALNKNEKIRCRIDSACELSNRRTRRIHLNVLCAKCISDRAAILVAYRRCALTRPFFSLTMLSAVSCLVLFSLTPASGALPQSLGNAGTVVISVSDPSGALVPGANAELHNPVTQYSRSAQPGQDGKIHFVNLPANQYHLTVQAPGFTPFTQDLTVRNAVPVNVDAKLSLAGTATSITVEASGADLLETDPSDHQDVDRNMFSKLPSFDPGSSLSQAITFSTGGVAADANGFFHPLGDHAQVTFVIDGQPISDQQSKVFSTQLPTSAIQSMQLNTGAPDAEFGDKTSLVDQVTTRSGLGANKRFGSVETYYGSFGSVGGDVSYGFGNEKFGNFIAVDGTRSGRFLDSPEFTPFHDKGNNGTIFDRLDFQPNGVDTFHLNLFVARNWIQIPNDYDQLSQDQRQRVITWNIAPGYQHTFNSHMLLTVNPYARKDQFNYYPSRDPFDDIPSTQSQSRQLFNYGLRSDLSVTQGRHNIKVGLDLKQTRLIESFDFGITDPTFNAVCDFPDGSPVTAPDITNPSNCAGLGYVANPNLQPGLIPFDLSRDGREFQFRASHNVNQYAAYVQDSITLGKFVLNLGLRGDSYYGLTSAGAAEPRIAVSYKIAETNTVLRAAYSRTLETPFNENLLLSSASNLSNGVVEGVLGASASPAISPGTRNQYNAGFQQTIGKYILIDADYFWKYTHNAFDFSTLQNTTITFPIAWNKSKLDGVTGRLTTTDIHGFVAYWTFGHTRARYFPPQSGGLLNTSNVPTGVFRIDHDQEFQSTANLRYQRPKKAEYISFIWRYDSGLVVSGVPDVAAALMLTAAQQTSIGFACDGVYATFTSPIRACNSVGTSRLLTLPQTGTENDDHNPDRVKPRNVFDLSIGTDNLLHTEGDRRIIASIDVQNLANITAVYNFLSTFSGTHFLAPRTIIGRVGFSF